MEDTKQMQENPELSLEEQDRSRRRKKKVRAAMSFGIMALLLLALFFASVNIGSLKVSLSEMLRGMLGEVSENAATVFDLRFPGSLFLCWREPPLPCPACCSRRC